MNDEGMYGRIAFVLGSQHKNWKWLARKMNYSEQRVSNWKSRGIPMKQLIDIAACLNVSVDWLLTGPKEASACSIEDTLSIDEKDVLLLWRCLAPEQKQVYYRTLQELDNET
jgi:hypothetical protein